MKNRIFKPLSSALLILIVISSFILPFVNLLPVTATIAPVYQQYNDNNYAWYSVSWTYRKSVTLSRASGAVTNYQMKLLLGESSGATGEDVDCGAKCQTDFDDIRFTTSDGTTLLDYWIESISGATPNQLATIWIEFDSIGAGATTFYVYYGNAAATSVSSGANTFIFFDDFERGNNGDAVGGNWTIAFGDCDISADHAYGGSRSAIVKTATAINAPATIDDNVAVRFRFWKEDLTANANIYAIDSGTGDLANVVVNVTEDVLYNDGGSQDTGDNCAADAWQLLELNDFNWAGRTYDIWLNGAEIQADAAQFLSSEAADLVQFYNSDAVAGHDLYVDNVIVRNFRATEPAWGSWGSESTGIPTVTTQAASAVEETTATGNGNITNLNDGGNATVQGIQYDTDTGAPYANDAHNDGSYGTGAFTVSLTGLTKGELYYARAYATNPMGTGYGAEVTFLTKPDPPNTFAAVYASDTEIALTWAKGTGAQKTVIRAKLNSYPANIADGTGIYNDVGVAYTHTGLTLGDHWYYRAWSYATEGGLTQYSDTYAEVNLILANTKPELTTLPCTGFEQTWTIVNATMDDDKTYAVTSYGFQYGLTSGLGTTATITGTIADGAHFKYRLSGLKAATVYYYRAFAVNSEGTGYGAIERFATKGSPSVYEYYETGGNNDSISIYGANWAYQTFTTGTTAHTITSVRLYLKRVLAPGDITVSIRHATADKPTGVDIVSTTLDGDTIGTAYNWYTFTFTELGFEASTDYAIVVRCLDGTVANYVMWQINDAGGYADGVYGTSANGGTTWTDTADDCMFEVWGNPCMQIQDVKVFNGYKATGDWLITIRYINIYPPYYDTYDIRKYFTFDLLDLGAVVRGSAPLTSWGNRVGSLYLSAAQVGALQYGAAYTVRIYGLFGANPYTDYVLQPADYQGSNLTNLDSWVISSASVCSTYYNTAMTVYITNKGEVLNSTGGTVMSNGISGLAIVRPGIFQTASAAGGHIDTPQSQTGVEANPQAIVGPQVWSWVTNIGAPVGADGRQILMLLFVGFYFILSIWAFVPGQTIAANILGLPLIFGASAFGLSFIYIVILCIVSAFLFVKHFWMDKRA